jgi:hypothetical protein
LRIPTSHFAPLPSIAKKQQSSEPLAGMINEIVADWMGLEL